MKTPTKEKQEIIARRKLNTAQFSVKVLPDELRELISDGCHSFKGLYEHRIELFITLCRVIVLKAPDIAVVWRSKLHSDGTSFEGWFVLGIGLVPGWQMTYHLPESRWKDCDFADTLEMAPEFDGHSSMDVLDRLRNFYTN